MTYQLDQTKFPGPITRELVRSHLLDADLDETDTESVVQRPRSRPGHPQAKRGSQQAIGAISSSDDEVSLDALQAHLDRLAHEEWSSVDRAFEYERRDLDQSTSGAAISQPAIDTKVLDSISKGLGPRPNKKNDADASIVGFPKEITKQILGLGSAFSPRSYTYQELQDKVASLNRGMLDRTCTSSDDTILKEQLLKSLWERIRALVHISEEAVPTTDLDGRVMKAIQEFRPETISFNRQDPYHLLALIIANHLVAKPDLTGADVVLWDAIFKAMLMEVRLQVAKEDAAKKLSLRVKLDAARKKGNSDEVQSLKKEITDLNEQRFAKAAAIVINDLKRARKELWKKSLEEQLQLATAQAGLKWYMRDLLVQPVPELLWQECINSEMDLLRVLRNQVDDLTLEQDVACGMVDVSHERSMKGLRRARKFAALDVPEEQRSRVVKERMENPLTFSMMMSAVEDTQSIQEMSRAVLKRLEGMESGLQEAWTAAKRRLQAYDEVYIRIMTDDEPKRS